jgi:hypothetical protein
LSDTGELTLTPHCAGEQDVQRGNGLTPGHLETLLDPLGMLVDHGVNDVDEGLVAVEKSMATGENVAFEPALHGVLRQHLHDSAFRAEVAAVFVLRQVSVHPDLLSSLVDFAELVALRLIRTHDAEGLLVVADDRVEEFGKLAHAWSHGDTRLVDLHGKVAEVLQAERAAEKSTVRDGVLGHALALGRRELSQLWDELAFLAEELLGVVGVHPLLEHLQLLRFLEDLGERDLVGAPESFEEVAFIVLARRGPAFGGSEDDHRPSRPVSLAGLTSRLLVVQDLLNAVLHGCGHGLVHGLEVVTGNDVGCPAIASHEREKLLFLDSRQDGRVVDLVAVEVQDGQHTAILDRVEKFVAVPAGSKRTGLTLSVSNDCQGDGLGVVKDGTESVGERVSELAALVDASHHLRRHVAAVSTGEGELLEEALHAFLVLRSVWVSFAPDALEVEVGNEARRTMAGTGDDKGIEVILLDHAVEMDVAVMVSLLLNGLDLGVKTYVKDWPASLPQ